MATDTDPINMRSDLISSLPDDLLLRILCLLMSKHAVQTCVLSKRWKHLWTFVPSLYLCDYRGGCRVWGCELYPDYDSDDSTIGHEEFYPFFKFAFKFLENREEVSFDTVGLSGWGSEARIACDEYVMLIHDLVEYLDSVRVLHIYHMPPCALPPISGNFLEELNLFDYCLDVPHTDEYLPNLRKLVMYQCYCNYDCLNEILRASTNLEYLRLNKTFLNAYSFCHGTLKHLAFTDSYYDIDSEPCPILLVVTPKLLLFRFRGHIPLSPKSRMPSLLSADLMMPVEQITGACGNLGHFLGPFANVEHLSIKIQCDESKVLEELELPMLPEFENLKEFNMFFVPHPSIYFRMITWFLRSMPNLRKLALERLECTTVLLPEASIGEPSLRIDLSQCNDLEMIEITMYELDWLEDLLANALFAGTKESQHPVIVVNDENGTPRMQKWYSESQKGCRIIEECV